MAEEWSVHAFDFFTADQLVDEDDLNPLNNSLRFIREVNYTEFTAPVTVSATTAATATTVVSSGAITYEAVPHLIEFFSERVATGVAGDVVFNLWDSGTDLGRIGHVSALAPGTLQFTAPVKGERRLTPTAASHTYIVKAWRATSNGTVHAGVGGTDTPLPGFIRITRIPT